MRNGWTSVIVFATISLMLLSCKNKRINALTGTTDADFSTGWTVAMPDTIYDEPILSIAEYSSIDSLVRIATNRDSNYIHYKDKLRDAIGDATDDKLFRFIQQHEIPLDSMSLFNRQIKSDFGADVSTIINGEKQLFDSLTCEVVINENTNEFRNLIYSSDAFCSWEPTYKTELYASLIDNTLYMYNNFPSKFKKRYEITVQEKGETKAVYTLIDTEIYTIYSKCVDDVTHYFIMSTILLDNHYEWAYFKTGAGRS